MVILYIALSLIAFVAIMLSVIGAVGYKQACVSQRIRPPETIPKKILRTEIRKKNNAYLYSTNPEDLELTSADGLKLKAWFAPSVNGSKRFAICIHGHNCNGPDECSHLFPLYRNTLGYNYLLPDLRGHGRSEGHKIGFSALDYKDINLWIDYLVDRFGEDIEIILHGISMGAATAMMVNNHSPRKQVKLIIEDCGFTNAYEQVGLKVKQIMKGREAPHILMMINLYCKIFSKYDLKKDADPLGTMKNAVNPVLFIHGEEDDLVPFYMCGQLYEACPVSKEIFTVPGATHAYSYYDAKEEYDKKVMQFIEKHLDNVKT